MMGKAMHKRDTDSKLWDCGWCLGGSYGGHRKWNPLAAEVENGQKSSLVVWMRRASRVLMERELCGPGNL